MDVSFQFAHGTTDHSEVDPLAMVHKSSQERLVAHRIDKPRHALALVVNGTQSRARETRCPVTARYMQPMLHIFSDFVAGKRTQMVADGDALAELAQAEGVQTNAQLRLPEQNDLQQLAIVRL